MTDTQEVLLWSSVFFILFCAMFVTIALVQNRRKRRKPFPIPAETVQRYVMDDGPAPSLILSVNKDMSPHDVEELKRRFTDSLHTNRSAMVIPDSATPIIRPQRRFVDCEACGKLSVHFMDTGNKYHLSPEGHEVVLPDYEVIVNGGGDVLQVIETPARPNDPDVPHTYSAGSTEPTASYRRSDDVGMAPERSGDQSHSPGPGPSTDSGSSSCGSGD